MKKVSEEQVRVVAGAGIGAGIVAIIAIAIVTLANHGLI